MSLVNFCSKYYSTIRRQVSYQSVLMNFNKDKNTFSFAVIIIKQLLTKQFSMNIKSSGKQSVM